MAYRAYFNEERKFGVELEGYGLPRSDVVKALEEKNICACYEDHYKEGEREWTVGCDGTIRRPNAVELISPILYGRVGIRKIKNVCDVANAIGLQTDFSCGLHVHWNVADFTGRSTINLLKLYAKYEKVLDKLFSCERRGDTNRHARSLIKENGTAWIYALNKPFYYRAYQIAQEFEQTQPLENTESFPSARHHKINLCAINKYGTVEFRQHQGTFDYDEIAFWLVLSQQLLNRAKDSLVTDGVATWAGLVKTLGLSDAQLNESLPSPDKKILRDTREFYQQKYRESAEKTYAIA